jgi:FkbM family methyltransferase
MSTKYFLLLKHDESLETIERDQIIYPNSDHAYILPQVNLEYYSKKGLFESQLIEWSKQLCSKDKSFLDIGAHTGTYSISLAKYAKHVYAFEPQKMTYYALCGSIALSTLTNITAMQVGLGSRDQVGLKTLNIVSNDGGGSSLHQSNMNIMAEEQIQIETLDRFQIENVGFIKMDVEENELYVLQGAEETLRRSNWPKILFESNADSGDVSKKLFAYLTETLQYRIVQIYGSTNMYLAERY